MKFKRTNQGTCFNQRPVVTEGQKIKKGDVLADGPATDNGRLALGKNILVAFMPWMGYNFEDAILISERLVEEDIYTSIHIEQFEVEARETKLGREVITRDIPNLSEKAFRDLDQDGIVRRGAYVQPDDILVGKVTPKGEQDLTPEYKLLHSIFGEKAREVRDTSLRVPNGVEGIVVDVKRFSREQGDELAPGVEELVKVYIADKRKISVGDKMAGRHGNKGVISKIVPSYDMPYPARRHADGHRAQSALGPVPDEPGAAPGNRARLGRREAEHALRDAHFRRREGERYPRAPEKGGAARSRRSRCCMTDGPACPSSRRSWSARYTC